MTKNSLPRTVREEVEMLEAAGLGANPYTKALKYGLEEEKETPGQGRATFMNSMKMPDHLKQPRDTE